MRFTPPDGVLNLAQTLDCGQSFRFYPVTLENNIPAWRGVAFSRGLTVYQDENNDLVLDCTEQEFRDIWFDYFDFNTDYKKSREVLSALHPALKEAAEFAGGIRILKQEPFEALCSFIISQNNNIPRIKGIIERLCLHFGEPFLYHNETRYAFPAPKKLASCTPEDLAPLRAGFRAKYLIDAAKRIFDFCAGLACGVGGAIEELGDRCFVVLPAGRELSQSDIDKLVADGTIVRD